MHPCLMRRGDRVLHLILRTPAIYFSGSKEEIVRILLRNGADPLARDSYGDTSLHIAAGVPGSETVIRLLFEDLAGGPSCLAAINSQNAFESTPLFVSTLYENLPCMTTFLQYGADSEVRGEYQKTPLEIAVELGKQQASLLLLKHRAAQMMFRMNNSALMN